MFTPSSLSVALLMMIISAVCWGSWANTYKGVKGYRFELFYWDYAVGIFLISLVLAFTMGSAGHDSSSFLNNVRSADRSNIVMDAMIGGAIFNLANLLLVAAIDMAGLAVAFPVSIGIALVVGAYSVTSFSPGERAVPNDARRGMRIDCGRFSMAKLMATSRRRDVRFRKRALLLASYRASSWGLGAIHGTCE